jgi:hypothetical protein
MSYRWTLTNVSDSTSTVLTKDPIGWDEGTYVIKRSEIYKGAFHEYTTSLKFHCDGGGKQFVDNVYQTEDIDGRINVLVEYDCDGSGTYDELFTGIINLASYKTDGQYTTVNIERSDLLTKFNNRDEISVDLTTTLYPSGTTSIGGESISSVDSELLELSSSTIVYTDEWVINNAYEYSFDYEYAFGEVLSSYTSFNMILGSSDMDTALSGSEYTDFSTTVFEQGFIEPIVTFNEPAIIYPITVNWSIDWGGVFTDTETDPASVRINFENKLFLVYGKKDVNVPSSLTLVELYNISGYGDGDYSNNFDVVTNGQITIHEGDSIWLAWFVESETTSGHEMKGTCKWVFDRSVFNFNTTTRFEATQAKSILIHEAFNQVVDCIADSDGNFYSEFYGRTDSEKQTYLSNGCGAKIALTNGFNIREFTDKPIYASFKDLFESMDCIHNIGMGYVNNKIRVEPLSYWFEGSTQIISLPNVNKYEQRNDNTRYFNKIEIGYQKWESEFHGGLDDPNARHEYSTKISSVKNIYNKLCKYLTSSYTIEFTRRKNKVIEPTQDWRYDNDNFLISVVNDYNGLVIFYAGLDGNYLLFLNDIKIFPIGSSVTISGTTYNNGVFTITDVGGALLKVAETVTDETAGFTHIVNNGDKLYANEIYLDSFNSGSGMTALSTAYNLRLTPKRMLLAHLNVITAGLQMIHGSISFIKGEGNTELVLATNSTNCQEDYNGEPIAENDSILWDDSNAMNIAPIWGTEVYSFEYPLTYTEFKTIKANPYGYVSFYKDAEDVKHGFILNMEYKMKTGMTKFELLKKA